MAQEYKGIISGIGDEANNVNVITGQIDSAFLNTAILGDSGTTSGIIANAYNQFGYPSDMVGDQTETRKGNSITITIPSGCAIAYGYKGVIDYDMQFSFDRASSLNTEYYYIILEWNTTVVPNEFKVKTIYMGTTESITLRQDDLVKQNGVGIYQMLLLSVKMKGTLDVDPLLVTNVITRYKRNLINCPMIADTVKRTTADTVGVTMPKGNYSQKIATTKFFHDNIYFQKGSGRYCDFFKIGNNVVICRIKGEALNEEGIKDINGKSEFTLSQVGQVENIVIENNLPDELLPKSISVFSYITAILYHGIHKELVLVNAEINRNSKQVIITVPYDRVLEGNYSGDVKFKIKAISGYIIAGMTGDY